jgi:phage shock protein PspC (stress-responsive transcriptional regulator)
MEQTRRCPYCAEEIRVEAIRCRYCQSHVGGSDPGDWFRSRGGIDPAGWYRSHPERKLAGVASAVAHGLGLPLAIVRVGFIVLTLGFFHLLGPALYVALWLVIPLNPGEDSLMDRGIARLRALVTSWQHSSPPRGPRANGHDTHAFVSPDVPGGLGG